MKGPVFHLNDILNMSTKNPYMQTFHQSELRPMRAVYGAFFADQRVTLSLNMIESTHSQEWIRNSGK